LVVVVVGDVVAVGEVVAVLVVVGGLVAVGLVVAVGDGVVVVVGEVLAVWVGVDELCRAPVSSALGASAQASMSAINMCAYICPTTR
jgi:hypothetical protein